MKIILLLISSILLCASPALAEKHVVGYFPAWMLDELPAEDVDFDVVTNIVYAFAWPNDDGSFESYSPPASPELIEAAHSAGRKVSISIGGGGHETGFPTIIADPSLRAAFIDSIFAFCDLYGYDGADFDWEFPQSTDQRDGYAALIRELRNAVDQSGRDFLISMAISAASWPSFSNDVAALNDVVDWFFVMCYDYSGPWGQTAGHQSPLYSRTDLGYSLSVSRSMEYLLETRTLALDKIVLGIPFYGRQFNASKLFGSSSGGDALRYSVILGEIAGETWTEEWDDKAKAPYLLNADKTKLITYDNEESVRAKCEFALENDLAGVGIWALGYDYNESEQTLVDVIGDVMATETFVENDVSDSTPRALVLAGNFPNPFNPSTAINYSLESPAHVRLEVFTVAGQRIAVLEDDLKSSGSHRVAWNAGSMPSGIYLYRISAGGNTANGRMTLLR